AGGVLFFAAADQTHGTELWKSNGTAGGTGMVTDVNPFTSSDPANFTGVGTTVYFTADDGVHGLELWKSDGTAGGTGIVSDLNVGPAGSHPDQLVAVGTKLFFVADDGTNDGLWVTSGGTPTFLKAGASNLVRSNGALLFTTVDPTNGPQLWKTDGTAPTLVASLGSGSTVDAAPVDAS